MMPGTYKKREFCFGKQEIAPIQGVKSTFYVMPSSSARCAAFPTAETKLPWFKEVKGLGFRSDLYRLNLIQQAINYI